MTCIINKSFETGSFPLQFKSVNILPIIKGTSKDPEELQNYRPIANIKFFAKISERIATSQLQEYLRQFNLYPKVQSAYRKFHSVETALVRVTNDILVSLDKGEEVILVLLDYSSAFDALNHDTLLNRLSQRFGIQGKALAWFRSYLLGRTQRVVIGENKSTDHVVTHGVPQGSVLGPVLFLLYTSPLEDLINSFGVQQMFYADDTQLYLAFKKNDIMNVIPKIVSCIQAIEKWSICNGLKLNSAKTEFLHITSRFRAVEPIQSLDLDGTKILAANTCRNLGITLDDKLVMEKFVSQKCSSASFALYKIGKIRDFIDKDTAERLVHAFVMCHLDFCNGLLCGLPAKHIKRLQTIQNSAARVISKIKKHEHITPVLRNLHWLPVQTRIQFKILLLAYECFYLLAPQYLIDLLQIYTPDRNLSSKGKDLFVIPNRKTKFYGERTFVYNASILWNNLPQNLRQITDINKFKSALKTHFFKL